METSDGEMREITMASESSRTNGTVESTSADSMASDSSDTMMSGGSSMTNGTVIESTSSE